MRTSRIQREKKEKEPFRDPFDPAPSQEELSLFGALNLLLSQLGDVVKKHEKLTHGLLPTELLYALLDLKYFFNAIERLPEEGFTELYAHLSDLWLYIDTELRLIQRAKWKNSSQYQTLVSLLTDVGAYTALDAHPLSYYFLRYKKDQACPQELIHLFISLQQNAPLLSSWSKQIDQIAQ